MIHYVVNGEVFAFDEDVDPSPYLNMSIAVLMTEEEVDRHYNPEKYLSDSEKIQLARKRMPTLTPKDFDLKLVKYGLYTSVQDLISTDFELKIAYIRAGFFSRTDPFIEQARIVLALTDEQVDSMWMN